MNERWTIELDQLLTPISPENLTGEALKYDIIYDQIKEARRFDDPNLSQGVWEAPLKEADWELVADICADALMTRSKDLQIAAWLTESWLFLHGVSGLHHGVVLMTRLCESYWDDLYPELVEGDMNSRLSPFRWLNDKFYVTLKQIQITQPEAGDAKVYNWIDWERALHNHSQPQKKGTAERTDQAVIQESITLTSTHFYQTLEQDLQQAIDAIQVLGAFLLGVSEPEPMRLIRMLNVLQRIEAKIQHIVAERRPAGEEAFVDLGVQTALVGALPSPADPGQAIPANNEGGSGRRGRNLPVMRKQINSRNEAYQQLAYIADYLTQIEPHSPVPYLIKRAVHWGSMPLSELLQEFVESPAEQKSIYDLLGIRKGGEA